MSTRGQNVSCQSMLCWTGVHQVHTFLPDGLPHVISSQCTDFSIKKSLFQELKEILPQVYILVKK